MSFLVRHLVSILITDQRGYYDIAHVTADPFPPQWYVGYLAKNSVQAALGVPVNYTESVNSVYYAFDSTGDYPRGGFLADLAFILESGIKVALVYGDRDYACNCKITFNLSTVNAKVFKGSEVKKLV